MTGKDECRLVYYQAGQMPEKYQQDVDFINLTCLSGDADNPSDVEADLYDWGAPEDGLLILLAGGHAVGRAAVHLTNSEYRGKAYRLGGFGGLAVLPAYQGHGYGRQLAEAALSRARALGVDVACMCVNMKSGITAFYERLGFRFLGRPAYFHTWNGHVKADETVMVLGLNNPALAHEIRTTDGRFHYGDCKGHW